MNARKTTIKRRSVGYCTACSCGWRLDGVWTKRAALVWSARHERRHQTGVIIGGYHAHRYSTIHAGHPLCEVCGFIKVMGMPGPRGKWWLGGMS